MRQQEGFGNDGSSSAQENEPIEDMGGGFDHVADMDDATMVTNELLTNDLQNQNEKKKNTSNDMVEEDLEEEDLQEETLKRNP